MSAPVHGLAVRDAGAVCKVGAVRHGKQMSVVVRTDRVGDTAQLCLTVVIVERVVDVQAGIVPLASNRPRWFVVRRSGRSRHAGELTLRLASIDTRQALQAATHGNPRQRQQPSSQ